mmetsp:Transcript_27631/g.62201  ORF Transcript_27631/g.62201 Transcript_27631/m.62201 type:complete len:363 (+) Transcript_27631:55-1143(+)
MSMPLESFVDESLVLLLGFLPAADVAATATAGRRFRSVGLCPAVWESLCSSLWRGRAVLRRFDELRRSDPREAYKQSLADSRRTTISKGELLSIEWSFRFKAAAGESWQRTDPWWQGQDATRVRFKKNGRACFKRGPLFGSRPPVLRWRMVRFSNRTHQELIRASGQAGDEDFTAFGTRGVRAEVMGREVPSYCVRRNKHNWGWTMESCWVVWSSWPMPRRDTAEAYLLDDDRLPVSFDVQEDEAVAFNTGLRQAETQDEESESEDSHGLDNCVIVPADWLPEGPDGPARAGTRGGYKDDEVGEEEEEEDDEEEQRPSSPMQFVLVRVGDHLVRLPRVLVENTSPDLLEMMLRRSLETLAQQ